MPAFSPTLSTHNLVSSGGRLHRRASSLLSLLCSSATSVDSSKQRSSCKKSRGLIIVDVQYEYPTRSGLHKKSLTSQTMRMFQSNQALRSKENRHFVIPVCARSGLHRLLRDVFLPATPPLIRTMLAPACVHVAYEHVHSIQARCTETHDARAILYSLRTYVLSCASV
jgi:hypothetical protein